MRTLYNTRKPVVAVIDDDVVYLEYVRLMLSRHVHSSTGFTDLESCLDFIRLYPEAFDVVVVDRFLSDEDAVKDRFPEACSYLGFTGKVVLLSSSITTKTSKECSNRGFYRCMNKGHVTDWKLLITV